MLSRTIKWIVGHIGLCVTAIMAKFERRPGVGALEHAILRTLLTGDEQYVNQAGPLVLPQLPEYCVKAKWGWALCRIGRVPAGLDLLRQSLAADPDIRMKRHLLQWLLRYPNDSRLSEAESLAAQILQEDPRDALPLFATGEIMRLRKDPSGAIGLLRESIRRMRGGPSASWEPYASWELGMALVDSERYEEAEAIFQRLSRRGKKWRAIGAAAVAYAKTKSSEPDHGKDLTDFEEPPR
jgi:tetratricopeptide (TPR) repeat protein